MNTKTMEGLVGANANINLINTPFKVYKDAERRGDTATMERAMGYVVDFSQKAYEYKAQADEGMEEEAKEAREQEKEELEKTIEKRREERGKLEDRIEETRTGQTETEDGKTGDSVSKNQETAPAWADKDTAVSANTKNGKEPVIYTKNGEISLPEAYDFNVMPVTLWNKTEQYHGEYPMSLERFSKILFCSILFSIHSIIF